MAPRAKATSEAVEPARRSTRISAQPKAAVEVVKEAIKKVAAPKASKKRAADAGEEKEVSDEAPVVKKVCVCAQFILLVFAG